MFSTCLFEVWFFSISLSNKSYSKSLCSAATLRRKDRERGFTAEAPLLSSLLFETNDFVFSSKVVNARTSLTLPAEARITALVFCYYGESGSSNTSFSSPLTSFKAT